MEYFFVIDKNDISQCKLGNILILFNSKQTKEDGRAFKSKYDHLIMFGFFILSFVWISTLLLYYVQGFSKNSQLFFRIYSRFSGSLSANQCLPNDVHVGGF